jgi:hypothetical protein
MRKILLIAVLIAGTGNAQAFNGGGPGCPTFWSALSMCSASEMAQQAEIDKRAAAEDAYMKSVVECEKQYPFSQQCLPPSEQRYCLDGYGRPANCS